MKIEELEKLMDKFHDIYSEVYEEVLDELLKFAIRDKEGYIKYVNSQKIGSNSYRSILYEAIMYDANGWENFLLDQITYIIEGYESMDKKAKEELSSIYYLTNIDDLEKSFYTSAIDYFKTKLNSTHPEIRVVALESMVDLHFGGEIEMNGQLKRELQNQLKDKAFKVRLFAYLHLKEEDLLPKKYKPHLIDRIRMKMSSDYKNYMNGQKIGAKVAEQILKKNLG